MPVPRRTADLLSLLPKWDVKPATGSSCPAIARNWRIGRHLSNIAFGDTILPRRQGGVGGCAVVDKVHLQHCQVIAKPESAL